MPSTVGFNPARHLKWGDVCANSLESPVPAEGASLVFQVQSGTKGVDVLLGATDDTLCPVEAVTSYSQRNGIVPSPFSYFTDGHPLLSRRFVGAWL